MYNLFVGPCTKIFHFKDMTQILLPCVIFCAERLIVRFSAKIRQVKQMLFSVHVERNCVRNLSPKKSNKNRSDLLPIVKNKIKMHEPFSEIKNIFVQKTLVQMFMLITKDYFLSPLNVYMLVLRFSMYNLGVRFIPKSRK